MNYEVFAADNHAVQSQEHMELVLREATRSLENESTCLNNYLAPEFISCSWPDKTVTLRYKTSPLLLNSAGNMHGGMIAAVCDMTMGILTRYFKSSPDCVTVHLGMNYMRGVPSDDDVIVEARIEKPGRTIFFTSAKVYRISDRKLAASAAGQFM